MGNVRHGAIVLGVFLTLNFVSSAAAQDSCSVDEIIQPAIDAAAEEGGCNADGAYVTPGVLVTGAEACIDQGLHGERCKRSLREKAARGSNELRALVKEGLLGRAALDQYKQAISDLKDECSNNDGDGEDGDHEGTKPGNGGDGEHNTPNPNPSETPRPSPTPSTGLTLDQARHVIAEHCACHGQVASYEAYVSCVGEVVRYGVNSHLIASSMVSTLMTEASSSSCGA